MEKDGTIFDVLSPERKSKSSVVLEDLDQKGLVRRVRIDDQNIFDALLVAGIISRSDHEGSVLFLDDLERSGVFIQSVDINKASHTPSYKVGDAVSSRWLAFSSAYRWMCQEVGDDAANDLMRSIPIIHNWKTAVGKNGLEIVGERVKLGLESLARYYRCSGRRDPRDIILKKNEGDS